MMNNSIEKLALHSQIMKFIALVCWLVILRATFEPTNVDSVLTTVEIIAFIVSIFLSVGFGFGYGPCAVYEAIRLGRYLRAIEIFILSALCCGPLVMVILAFSEMNRSHLH